MLVDIFLMLPSVLIGSLVSVFPVGSLPISVSNAFITMFSSLKALDSFIPISTLFSVLLIILGVEIMILISKLIRFGIIVTGKQIGRAHV